MARRKRVFRLSDGFQPAELIRYGVDHLRAAERLFAGSPLFDDSAGYLAHLGIELLLKSMLLHADGRFPEEHRLQQLYLDRKSVV